MRKRSAAVVGIGSVTWDRFLVVPRYPEADDRVRAIHAEESAGGTVATTLVALRRWGLSARFVGLLGQDDYADRILQNLMDEQIETDSVVQKVEADTQRNIVLVDNRTGSRSIISGPHRVLPIQPEDLPLDLFEQARLLHLDTSVDECGLQAAARAKEVGLTVTLAAHRVADHTAELLRRCDYVLATLRFAQQVTGEEKISRAAYALHLQTARPVVVTDGPRGCEYASAEISFFQSAQEVPVVDSTGAGDVFHAAFLYGVLTALDPRTAVRLATWAAASVCRELGSRKGIPTHEALREYLHSSR